MPMQYLILRARPRVAPLGWPHKVVGDMIGYQWVSVKPDGSGWTSSGIHDDSLAFPENKLDDVLEGFYASAGPYPYDFCVLLTSQPVKTKSRKKTTKVKKTKKTRRSKG
jgi:hypothetical protein